MALSYKDVAEILKIIDASSCEEVILELEGIKLTVRRGASGYEGGAAMPASAPAPAPAPLTPQTSTAPATPAQVEAPTAGTAVESGDVTIRAPMVGTFYRAPSPGKPAFVEVGSSITAGDPVCLIEVMKLYTTIESTHTGTIRAINANDGDLVEFDQPLFVIDPD